MCALCHVFWELWTVVLEKTLESPLDHKEIKPVNPKENQSWIFIGRLKLKLHYFGHLMQRTDWKRPWWWERLKAGGEVGDRGWDGWMVSLTQWTCVLSCFSRVWPFVTLWTVAPQDSLSITNSQSLLKLMSIKSMMPSNHLLLCHPLLLLPSVFPSIRRDKLRVWD